MKKIEKTQQGFIVLEILFLMTFLILILFALVDYSNAVLFRARGRVFLLQAQYAAESGADEAIAMLNNVSDTYTGTPSEVTVLSANLYKSTFTVSVANGTTPDERVLTSIGKVYIPASSTTSSYTRTIRVVAQRSSTTTSSSLVSRNILDINSGVKNLTTIDVFVNAYINMAKNTTNLIAENITAAGKNTGASNCSIGGSGNLVKPSSFTHNGQTKTNLTLAYNNCISPPGNTSNSNFNVLANQTTISKIQSTYIPWNQYMDSSYLKANSCSDWTSGSFPISIPSTGNTKKTHYPDSGSNISSSCGTNGDLTLGNGQYNILDNVHIRANLCATSGCTPTFNNPSTTLRWIFVEGTVNFSSLQTASGSGPMVLVVYGSDPSSLAGSCPDGGAFHLANSGTTSAPAIYVLASNGVCLDKTKFGSAQALGGVSGKNIYVATNPGTPFDLGLNPNFPDNQIPTNLSWRAILYQRL